MLNAGPATARNIVEERGTRPFRDWADLVRRVVGLGAAKTALRSLEGAPFDPAFAAELEPGKPISPAAAVKLQSRGL